ncbi:NADH-ubiquinone oxidoreductase 21.3 kDa subunit-like protein [Hapsidospora chrysogenum ATCC 11550]|uniref:NADH-ubiquinone oxidoreductase 21.3 kDa subunit-like protein n=1 Tax=Hapsidospora chrysogenum (strain ATCC 11550 / CBS 779.69 / DSM 880 / IAM 14645 / JCM 23072 / IMI 49137) TaxID=857340 RepID=A0A086SUZ6_HAPC1|nr:NADH-ubiquinone oxidoreductase 21.3 kDa subunit-like protein [Hapsidospora chrysogenum ATCC 11550]
MERQTSLSPKAHLESHRQQRYVPHDVLDETTKAAVTGLLFGAFVGGVRNAMSRQNLGVSGYFIKQAPLIGLVAASSTTYVFVRGVTLNLLERDDAWGGALGGFAAGSVLGLPFRRFPPMLACGAGFGILQGAFELFGGRLDSIRESDDEFHDKEVIRRTTRIPVEQTVAEIGEGRGIQPPGYEERRRQRIKEKYGFDINPVKATVEGSE